MPYKLSAREVLLYLNELGYNNINAQQLKEFMHDLKKLIKYDLRKNREGKLTIIEDSLFEPSCDSTRLNKEQHVDVFANLHTQQTVESQAKIVPKKENVICVQIKRPKLRKIHSLCKHKENQHVYHHDENTVTDNGILVENNIQTDDILELKKVSSLPEEANLEVKKSKKALKKKELKPTVSYIRKKIRVNLKSDPVALYHQYQAEWKKHPVPGEDSRADLRWAIREQMLGGPRPPF